MHKSTLRISLTLGTVAGTVLAVLSAAYALVLAIGILTSPSRGAQIQNPWFTLMEILILIIVPTMIGFSVGIHSWTRKDRKAVALLGVAFMSMCGVVTSCVHFAILTLSRQQAFAAGGFATRVFSFEWPSIAYALDILAWDFFFPLGACCTALAIDGGGKVKFARALMFGSGLIAMIGMLGVPMANMNVRNIGIIGYVFLFPVATGLLASVLRQQPTTIDAQFSSNRTLE